MAKDNQKERVRAPRSKRSRRARRQRSVSSARSKVRETVKRAFRSSFMHKLVSDGNFADTEQFISDEIIMVKDDKKRILDFITVSKIQMNDTDSVLSGLALLETEPMSYTVSIIKQRLLKKSSVTSRQIKRQIDKQLDFLIEDLVLYTDPSFKYSKTAEIIEELS